MSQMRRIFKEGIKRLITQENTAVTRYTRGKRRASVIALSSQKGGVGKTTSAASLAVALATYHKRQVLILDMDPQGHVQRSLSSHVRVTAGHTRGLSNVLLSNNEADVLDVIRGTAIDGVHITLGDPALSDAEALLATKIGKEMRLRDALSYARTHYDHIIIDCPPNLGNLTLNALVAADVVIVPCDLSPLAVAGLSDLVSTMMTISTRLNQGLDLLGVLMTRVDGRNRTVNDQITEDLKEVYGDLIFDAFIGIDTTISKAQIAGRSVVDYAAGSRASKQYRALSDEVVTRLAALSRPAPVYGAQSQVARGL